MKRLALIERNLLVKRDSSVSDRAISAVVRLHRAGWQIMLLAERPERWRPTRKSMDQAMSLQRNLHEALTEAGGDLDGVCYMVSGLIGQKKARRRSLEDLAERYGIASDRLTVISSQPRDLETALAAGAVAIAAGTESPPAGARPAINLKQAISDLLKPAPPGHPEDA